MIKLNCKICDYSFDVTEQEFREHPELYKYCFLRCGGENKITNLNEVLTTDIETTVKNNIIKWVKEIGWDNTIDIIKRNSNYAIQRLYLQELKRRGFNINDKS